MEIVVTKQDTNCPHYPPISSIQCTDIASCNILYCTKYHLGTLLDWTNLREAFNRLTLTEQSLHLVDVDITVTCRNNLYAQIVHCAFPSKQLAKSKKKPAFIVNYDNYTVYCTENVIDWYKRLFVFLYMYICCITRILLHMHIVIHVSVYHWDASRIKI